MTSTINASLSAGVVVTSDTSGSLAFQSNGTTIATISSTGLQQNVGAPAFSAYLSANQSISSNTYTKAQFNTTEFNVGNAYDATTNYRFLPTVAGYYQVNLQMYLSGAGSSQGNAFIYKNGASFKAGFQTIANGQVISVPAVIYLNGSTDYIEAYGYLQNAGGVIAGTTGNAPYCYFQASMIRSA